jgi:hypothetical protein
VKHFYNIGDARVHYLLNEKLLMEALKYTVIKDVEQYTRYCDILEELIFKDEIETKDEIELLTLLIEKMG